MKTNFPIRKSHNGSRIVKVDLKSMEKTESASGEYWAALETLEKDLDQEKNSEPQEKAQLPVKTNAPSTTGPIKAAGKLGSNIFIDYQPDVCKDYKQTGFCGFGDTCKFLHDRGDYLAGWQLDKAWDADQLAKGKDIRTFKVEDKEEELPWGCVICKKAFTDPVVSRCGHYFCRTCALKRYAKNPKCAACGSSTGGIFNHAEKILEKKEKMKQLRIKRKRQEADVWDEEAGSDES